ncbi:MAG: ATP-binding protein, partial [Pseudomonadota bacterium]
HDRPGLFPEQAADRADMHAHPLRTAPELDGYASDWEKLGNRLTPIPWRVAGRSEVDTPTAGPGPTPGYALGLFESHFYLLVRIPDRTPRPAPPTDRLRGDHIIIRTLDPDGFRHHYLVDTAAPGPLGARELLLDPLGQPLARKELRIQGVQRTDTDGVTLELRLPRRLLGPRLGLGVNDQPRFGLPRIASTHPAEAPLGLLVQPSEAIARVIQALGRTTGRRVWILDRHGRVLARGGSLWRPRESRLHPWLSFAFGSRGRAELGDTGPVDRLESPAISAAATGEVVSQWEPSIDGEQLIVSVAHPIWSQTEVAGVVWVEESSVPIQLARNDALLQLLLVTLVVFVLAAAAIAWFASSLSRRLNRLRDNALGAIDAHGRVVGSIETVHGRDEIGALAQTFASLLDRLNGYNHYLERLASRLSHELRTPLAVIRSSLDNLELDPRPEAATEYLQRARSGIHRLQVILTRMSEASRIEETVRASEPEHFDLAGMLAASIAGYVGVWPDHKLVLLPGLDSAPMTGTPDLLAQMLDKLAANATDFAAPGTPVEFALEAHRDEHGQPGFRITVTNHGARLPEDLGNRLFESMVSSRARSDRTDAEPHLGLGLYIVRLIVEHHRGTIRALQLSDPDAVSFEVWLPAEPAG